MDKRTNDKRKLLLKKLRKEADEIQEGMKEDVKDIKEQLDDGTQEKVQKIKQKLKATKDSFIQLFEKRFEMMKTQAQVIEFSPPQPLIFPALIGIITYIICCFLLCGEREECCGFLILVPLGLLKKIFCWIICTAKAGLEKATDSMECVEIPLEEIFVENPPPSKVEDWIFIPLMFLGFLLAGGLIGLLTYCLSRKNDDTLLKMNEKGIWEYAPSFKKDLAKSDNENGKEAQINDKN